MNVALIHDWLIGMEDEERCLESLCELFPSASLFTLFVRPELLSETLNRMTIIPSALQRCPWITSHPSFYAPFFPIAIEQFDLQDYELVISNSRHIAKGVLTQPDTCHICYSHLSVRAIWELESRDHGRRANPIARMCRPILSHYFRVWDVIAAQRVDHFIARSETIAAQIRKFYRRPDVTVIDPSDRIFKQQMQDYIQRTVAAFNVRRETDRRSFLQTCGGRYTPSSQA